MASDSEQEALWYLGGQRIIAALGKLGKGALRLTEWAAPAGTILFAQRHANEEEALYVLAGEAIVICEGQSIPVSAGTFLFLPGHVPYQMRVGQSSPLRYLTWMAPARFAYNLTKMGSHDQALLLAPLHTADGAKMHYLAELLRAQMVSVSE